MKSASRCVSIRDENFRGGWSFKEFAGIDFEDERLNQRLLRLAEAMAEYPMSPINQACQKPSQAKAAYRFFANPKTCHLEILKAHQKQSHLRALETKTIYVIQDTTAVNYSGHLSTYGLGMLRRNQNGPFVTCVNRIGMQFQRWVRPF